MKQIIDISIKQFTDFRSTFLALIRIAGMMLSLALLSIIVSLLLFQTVVSLNYVKVDNILGIEQILSMSIKAYSMLFIYSVISLTGYIASFIGLKAIILIKSGSTKFWKNYIFKKDEAV